MHEQDSTRKLCPDSKVVKLQRGLTGQLSSYRLHLSFWVTDKVRVTLEKVHSDGRNTYLSVGTPRRWETSLFALFILCTRACVGPGGEQGWIFTRLNPAHAGIMKVAKPLAVGLSHWIKWDVKQSCAGASLRLRFNVLPVPFMQWTPRGPRPVWPVQGEIFTPSHKFN